MDPKVRYGKNSEKDNEGYIYTYMHMSVYQCAYNVNVYVYINKSYIDVCEYIGIYVYTHVLLI
jgi:hypothetical protein